MENLEQTIQEFDNLKQAFKSEFGAEGISTGNVEFRNYPNLLKQTEKKLPTQTKSVNPSTSPQSVVADVGYKLTQVDVGAIQTEERTFTENGEYVPTSGKFISKVVVDVADISPSLQEKTITPTEQEQSVVPDNGYDGLSQVNVNAIPSEYIVPTGTLEITENGTHTVTQYESVDVNVEGITPTGTLNITQNGTYDVTAYASAEVNVPSEEPTSDVTDLDYIKYQDNMIQIETGKIPPTDDEYEQIIEDGYKILDYVFRGELYNGN